jgi:TatD DNase family protein
MRWIDTHCHLDAAELALPASDVRERAHLAGVQHCVIPAVEVANFEAVRALAHAGRDSYCLGIHPLYVPSMAMHDLDALAQALVEHASDPRLVAVGEIGLDFFVPGLQSAAMRALQEQVYAAQLALAQQHQLPVVLHVRRSADRLLKYLRVKNARWTGIAHAFNGSEVQAREFIRLGFKLGLGGAVTFERALQLRHLATMLPLDALVLETDSPDIPPHWLYTTAQQRADGTPQGRNEPAELPRIAQVVAALRGMALEDLAQATTHNACVALPKLSGLLV